MAAGGLGLSGVFVNAQVAHAGPDQDKNIFTRQHVDAPVPAWNPERRELFILANKKPAHDSALYLGRGWRNRTVKHLFATPNNPALGFLGQTGQMWLSAPQEPGQSNTPIWAGIGVDGSLSSISAELENGNYVLDLVDVHGPGRVESFIWTPWRVNRLFSSTDLNHRTVWNPRHMHAYTLFSKPGRYELNVAAVTRSADGTTVYSSPITPLVWQVGGSDPREGKIADYGTAFNTARTQRADGRTQGGTLTLQAKRTLKTVGDEALTDFTFTTGNTADQGHLIVLIDGFYMTEVPVVNGQAAFDEMIGDDTSTFQGIYIPTDKVSARYATSTVSFSRTTAGSVSSEGAATTLLTPKPAPSAELMPERHQSADGEVNITITPIEDDDDFRVNVEADSDLNAEISISWHKNKETSVPDCSLERQMIRGQLSVDADIRYCLSSAVMRVTINPHPYSNVIPRNFELEDFNFANGRTFTFNLPLRAAEKWEQAPRVPGWHATPYDLASANTELPSENPTPGGTQPGSTVPSEGNNTGTQGSPTEPTRPNNPSSQPSSLDYQPIRIHRGHLDIRLTPTASRTWEIAIKDDSLIGARHSVLRTPSAVTVVVPAAARQVRGASLAAPELDFLGPMGSAHYLLPEAENPALPWPGFSTEDIDYSEYPQGIDYKVTVRSAPANGRMFFATTADLGQSVTVHVDSSIPQRNTIHTQEASHLHGVWGFSQPGSYVVNVEALSAGKTLATGQLRFEVDLDQSSSSTPGSPSTTHGQVTPPSTQGTAPSASAQHNKPAANTTPEPPRQQGNASSHSRGQAPASAAAGQSPSAESASSSAPTSASTSASSGVRTSSRRANGSSANPSAASGAPARRGVLGGGTLVNPTPTQSSQRGTNTANTAQSGARKGRTLPQQAGAINGMTQQSFGYDAHNPMPAHTQETDGHMPASPAQPWATPATLIAAAAIGLWGISALGIGAFLWQRKRQHHTNR